MDMTSLFCLWMYDSETTNAEFQMLGYNQIQNFETDALTMDAVGIRALRVGGRRILAGLTKLRQRPALTVIRVRRIRSCLGPVEPFPIAISRGIDAFRWEIVLDICR
jgi:hypothetical protein